MADHFNPSLSGVTRTKTKHRQPRFSGITGTHLTHFRHRNTSHQQALITKRSAHQQNTDKAHYLWRYRATSLNSGLFPSPRDVRDNPSPAEQSPFPPHPSRRPTIW